MIRFPFRAQFPSGFWAVVLIASVALNGIALGLVAAGAVSGLRVVTPAPAAAPPQPVVRVFQRTALPREFRGDIERRIRESMRETAPLIEEVWAANGAAMQALAADPFDPEAARAAFDRASRARAALEERTRDATILIFSDLPAAERANMIRRAAPDGREWFRMRGDNMPGGGDWWRRGASRAPQGAPQDSPAQ